MMIAVAVNIGHHARVPAQLIAEIEKPRALQILAHLLTLCSPQKPEIWVDQGLLGEKLGIHRDTVGRWIRYLEQIGRLVFLGFRNDGRRKKYRINLPMQENTSTKNGAAGMPLNATSDDSVGRPLAKESDDVRQFCRNINKEEETNIKKQTVVDLSKKEFSPNEKIALKQKLKAIGVYKESINRLIETFSMEKINAQIEHLLFLVERGDGIQKPASWLIAAIEKDFPLPKELNNDAIEETQKAESIRNATMVAQDAKSELAQGNYPKAKELALKSLLLAQNHIAKDVVNEVNQILERTEQIKKAHQLISAEEQQRIRQEEEEKKLSEMRQWLGKSDAEIMNSALFKGAVDALVAQRLLAAA